MPGHSTKAQLLLKIFNSLEVLTDGERELEIFEPTKVIALNNFNVGWLVLGTFWRIAE